jgi:hypothetical protein
VQALLLEVPADPPSHSGQQCEQLWFHLGPR